MTAVDEMTELVDANIARVDLVGKAANGTAFLIAKAAKERDPARGILEQAFVADLVAKATDTQEPTLSAVAKADEPDLDAGGDALVGDDGFAMPGSAEWEQVDADTASKWTAILARTLNALTALCDREEIEASGDGDASEVWNLQDAICAVECAIDALAPYAVGEAAEVARQDEMAGVAKSALAIDADPFPLTTIEALMPVLKAGRVLSAGNEAKIVAAVDSLQQVLSSLPAAPEGTIMKSMQDVAKAGAPVDHPGDPVPGTTQDHIDGDDYDGKGAPGGNPEQVEANMGNPVTAADHEVPVPTDVKTLSGLAGSQEDLTGSDDMPLNPVTGTTQSHVDSGDYVGKAAPQQLVYDSQGNPLGIIDPSKITEFAPESGADAPESPVPDAAPDAAPDAPDDAPAPPADTTPAPSGDVGTPASDDVAKSDLAVVIKAALAEMDVVTTSVAKALEDRIATLEAPARTRVLSNGALPSPEMLRGMDQGSGSVSVAKAVELKARMDASLDPSERGVLKQELEGMAATALADVYAGRPIVQ